jgi:serine/threonine protein kinase
MNADERARVKAIFEQCLDLPPAERHLLLDHALAGEPDLRAELISLFKAHSDAGSFLDTPALGLRDTPLRMGPWNLIEEIGQGGLGRVFRGRRADGQYEQEVAVKLLKPGVASEAVLAYFERERRILAKLTHPHIARLLDAGMAAGQPYFVMELVDGEPIDAYVERAAMSQPDRLRLFTKVCLAVQYAHQHLVVHRDLKPANILVTREGEPKLLDFGIAKIISADPAEYAEATGLYLTPEYASPEQFRGEPVATATDIFSLGVVLYRLLCGRRPYPLNSASEEPPGPPSPGSPDLNNIVLKALEKEQQRRYESVGQFAGDIERFLGGYPVIARKPTLRYRLSRFVRRNRWGVAAAALALCSLVAGLAGTAWQWRKSEQRFQELRKLARSVLYEFEDAVRDIPGTTAARGLMLSRAVEYLDRLAASAPSDPSLRRELGEAYLRAAQIMGQPGTANLGKPEQARRYLEQARRILEPLPRSDIPAQRLLARTLNELGGMDNARAALAIHERNFAREPNKQRRNEMANGYHFLATQFVQVDDFTSALEWRGKELEIRRALYESEPGNSMFRSNYAMTSKRLGGILIRLDRLDEAMAAYSRSLAFEEQWLSAEPGSVTAAMAVSYSHSDIALILSKQKRFTDSLEHYRQAIAIRQRMARLDPNDAWAREALRSAYTRIADVLLEAGRRPEAAQFHAKTARLTETK